MMKSCSLYSHQTPPYLAHLTPPLIPQQTRQWQRAMEAVEAMLLGHVRPLPAPKVVTAAGPLAAYASADPTALLGLAAPSPSKVDFSPFFSH